MNKVASLVLLSTAALTGCTLLTDNSETPLLDDYLVTSSAEEKYPVEMFDFSASFSPDNQWGFSVTADMPTPCHTISIGDVLVAESYPEQVSINILVKEPSEDIACAQVIDTQRLTGGFQASDKASVRLNISVAE